MIMYARYDNVANVINTLGKLINLKLNGNGNTQTYILY